jgi:hypothetical protein
MNRYLKIAVFASFVILSPAAWATELWRGAGSGESQADILARFSDARLNPSPSTLGDGASCEVYIKNLDVARYPFQVCFYFLDDKLKQVMLSLTSGAKRRAGKTAYNTVMEALRSKYGAADNSVRMPDDFMTEDAWYLGDLNVNLVMFSVSEDSEVSFNVVYQTRVSENAKNL